MYRSNRTVHQLASTLLTGLSVRNPTLEQCQAAESFISMVILPAEKIKTSQEALTSTEWLCLNLTANGFSTEETADKLALTHGTIKNYRERIRQKLDCRNMVHAVYKAFLQGEESKKINE